MCNDNKRAKTVTVLVTTPMPRMVQIVPTRDMGGITKTRVTKVTREGVTMATKEVVEVSRGADITPMRTNTRVRDPVVGVTDTTPTGKLPSSFLQFRSGSR